MTLKLGVKSRSQSERIIQSETHPIRETHPFRETQMSDHSSKATCYYPHQSLARLLPDVLRDFYVREWSISYAYKIDS